MSADEYFDALEAQKMVSIMRGDRYGKDNHDLHDGYSK